MNCKVETKLNFSVGKEWAILPALKHSMSEQNIICPQCSYHIPLNEALSHQIKEKFAKEFEKEMKKQRDEVVAQQKAVEEAQAALANKEKSMSETIQKEVDAKLQKDKLEMWKKAQEEAEKRSKEKYELELKDLQEEKMEKDKQLEEAKKQELELRKKARELEEQKKNMDLELQRRLDEEAKKIEEQTKKQAEEENRLKLMEKDKQMEILKKTIEDLKRQSEQGSMQIQGEVQEADLKQLLQNTFPQDLIEDVPTGVHGADLIQTVKDNFGKNAGIIVWESKNTKTWSQDWIKKMKDDRALVQGDLCILISQALPDGIESFGLIDGVWVVNYAAAIPLATVLRFHLSNLSQAKLSLQGKDEKMEILYTYLTGTQFKNHIDGIVSAFISMQNELEREKRSMKTIWQRRQKEIDRVVNNTTALYGDIKGIFGASLPQVAELELLEEAEIEVEDEASLEEAID